MREITLDDRVMRKRRGSEIRRDKTERCIGVLDGVILYSAPKRNVVNTTHKP